MTDSSADQDPSERSDTTEGGSAVPAGSTQETDGGTPETETYGAAQESLDAAETSTSEPAAAPEDQSSDAPASDVAVPAAGDLPVEDGGDDGVDESDGADEDDDDNPLDTEGEIAADYLEELLDIADLDGDIDTYVESDRAHVSIVTEAEVLVGGQGEVLEALQELSRLAVMTETGHRSRLMLDVAGYRDRRRSVLADLATGAVQEVRTSGESVRLSPMNPFERKIVHDAVAAAGLTSESEGEEPGRRVVVLPVG